MKVALVYYSLEGNTQYVAEQITAHLDVDIFKLRSVKAYPKGTVSKYLWGGKSVMMGEKPELEPYDFNPNNYDLILIGTPIWASSYAPPIKTFLAENNLSQKKIALFTCSAGGGSQKCMKQFQEALPNCEILSTLDLVNPMKKKQAADIEKIKQFCQSF